MRSSLREVLATGCAPRTRPRSVAAMLVAAIAAHAGASLAAPALAHALARPKLIVAVTRAVAASGLPLATTGVRIAAAEETVPVVSINGDKKLVPASTMKLVTAATALDRLGPGYRWRTSLSCASTPTAGVIRGHLYLVGHGDPTLGTRARARAVGIWPRGSYLDDLADALRRRGIRRITGSVVADESFFDARRMGPKWKASYAWECPPLSALSVDRNVADDGGWEKQPAAAAARRLRKMLVARRVRIGGGLKRGRAPSRSYAVANEWSPPLYKVVYRMDRESDNFVGEMLAKTTGRERGRGGSTPAGARVGASELASAGVAPSRFVLVDGSGLSRSNRLAPSALVSLLSYAYLEDWGYRLEASLPLAGEEGTLKDRMRGTAAAGNVRAKTGTLKGVSTLAGYAESRAGTLFAFAVMVNGGETARARALQDRIAVIIAAYPGR